MTQAMWTTHVPRPRAHSIDFDWRWQRFNIRFRRISEGGLTLSLVLLSFLRTLFEYVHDRLLTNPPLLRIAQKVSKLTLNLVWCLCPL